MYSIKIAAKLVKIKQLYKKAEEQLSNFIVLSTYYLTFRVINSGVVLFCSITYFVLIFCNNDAKIRLSERKNKLF